MNINKWTMGLAAAGMVTLPAFVQAEEAKPGITALTPTAISGYVNTSAEWSPGTGNRNVPKYAFNEKKQDGFNLNVVSLNLEKALDESQWSAGYRVQALFGPDARALNTSSNPEDGSDFALKNAYVALQAPIGNGIEFDMGVWDTIIGYEGFDAGNYSNFSRSYGYTIEPTTHTGLLAKYRFCDALTLAAGVANTHGPSINERANKPGGRDEAHKTYTALATLTAPDDWGFLSGSALYVGGVNGWNSGWSGVQGNFYAGATLNTPCKNLKVGAAYDYAATTDSAADRGHADSIAAYASFQASEKLSLHLRGELASTDTMLYGFADDSGPTRVYAGTATVQYDLWKNVISRLEFRWDHLEDNSSEFYGGDLRDSGSSAQKEDYFTVALNVIYKF